MVAQNVMTVLYLASGLLLLSLTAFLYQFFMKPQPRLPGQYINPKLGRRKVTKILSPDCSGTLRAMIDEEGQDEGYSTLVIESEGHEILIPHVLVERDCKAMNPKQMFAGGDAPIMLCCVDRQGLRHPEMFDAIMTPKYVGTLGEADLWQENMRLRREHARLKQDLKDVSTDEAVYDKMGDMTENISRFRQAMLRFMPEGEEGIPPEEEKRRR